MFCQAGPMEFLNYFTYFRVKIKKTRGFAYIELGMNGVDFDKATNKQ